MNIQQFWRAAHAGVQNFVGVSLRGADLRGRKLTRLDLRKADLRGARLDDAILRGVDLRGANLQAASLDGADLTGADLRGAHITGAAWTDATLRGAQLDTGEWELVELQGGLASITGVSIVHRPETTQCLLGGCSETVTRRCRLCGIPLCKRHACRLKRGGKRVACPHCAASLAR